MAEQVPWGTYAASLPIPDCPDDSVLVVDTAEDERTGGEAIEDPGAAGATLSFVEALRIAHNRAGPDTIRFDQATFPVHEPRTIDLGPDPLTSGGDLPLTETCIDARERGVIIRFDPQSAGTMWRVGEGSLQIGLTMVELPYEQGLAGGQIAGCRYGHDGRQLQRGSEPEFLELAGTGQFGPGNSVAVGTIDLGEPGLSATVSGNFFGMDPATLALLPGRLSLDLSLLSDPSVRLEDNVFAGGVDVPFTGQGISLTFRRNFFGVDDEQVPLPGTRQGVTFARHIQNTVFGPGNVVRNTSTALSLQGQPQVTITQNRIFENESAIVYADGAPVAPPTITNVATDEVSGDCSVAGTVEVFLDDDGQGEQFVTDVECDPSDGFTVQAELTPGRNVTATLTNPMSQTSPFSQPTPVP
jgi:hypothetical protein